MAYDRDELADIVDQLDRRVPREGAWIELKQYGGGPDEGQVIGNREGYLRLGVEFLKAAAAKAPNEPIAEAAHPVSVDLEYLIDESSTINFDWFEICNRPEDQLSYQRTWIDMCVPLGCLLTWAVSIALISLDL